jgi:2-polyprenyl-6-methoxyphenol hydroxylase-like FAD-dependent oxidoreductase
MSNKVIIIGGGIAGLTTALALQKRNIDFIVYESVPQIKAVGAGISLAANAIRCLEKVGVAEEIKAKGQIISSMIIEDSRGKKISVLDANKISQKYGLQNVAIHRADLHEVLLSQIPADKIITSKKATDVQQSNEGVVIHFDDGTEADGTAAIVADGIHSVIRKNLLPQSEIRYSGYTCWRGITKNVWNIKGEAVETWGTRGRFGYVPIGNQQIYWFACMNASFNNQKMRNFSVNDLVDNFKNFAGPIPEILRNTSDQQIIWNDIIDLKPIQKYAFGRVALIGDAAHATTPNLGQGACLGIEDAIEIAERIEVNGSNFQKAFHQFEQKRIARATFIVNISERIGKIAQVENKLFAALRNMLFRITPERVNEGQLMKVLNLQ